MTWSLLKWILISKEGNFQARMTKRTVPNTIEKSPKVLQDEILNLQIVFIRTASCLRGQQSSLVVITAAQEKEEEETCTSRGLLALKNAMAIVICQRSESNLKPLLFVHFLSTPFAFKDTAVFGRLLSNEYAAIQKSQKGWVSDSFGRCNAKP